ncbi:MAG: bifunctional DNA-formamidopyrimidine glycosylase/DNA-(apurinic or apyrimidinic site) lyase [Myxococcota bacterium]|nr:bifunctional DNA-formamidopyrimidine glycosylase/DNA-(apurinic or apyrimidinic site) lyase [Myxococcota bacterium]
MPELPEVEVTRQRIAPVLVGRRIREVVTTGDSYLFLTRPERLRRRLAGRRVDDLERRGKYLLAGLDDGSRLVVHLGMTGQLFASGAASVRLLSATARASLAPEEQLGFEPDCHTHLRLRFEQEPDVYLRDVRKFGKVLLLGPTESHPRLGRLGVDALEVEGAGLFAASRGRSVAVKSFLLDQAVIAGVGNIYADEALFRARVRPGRRAGRVTRREYDALARAIRAVLERSIETGGSSIRDYVAPDGADGAYQDERRVYARAGEPCLECGKTIKRVVLNARSTHYCPGCQR